MNRLQFIRGQSIGAYLAIVQVNTREQARSEPFLVVVNTPSTTFGAKPLDMEMFHFRLPFEPTALLVSVASRARTQLQDGSLS